ncbi:hypothetical protein GDO78_017587, partial [Eleutherodactylus coqui]
MARHYKQQAETMPCNTSPTITEPPLYLTVGTTQSGRRHSSSSSTPRPLTFHSLQKRIAECRYWPVEIMRAPMSLAGKSKSGKAEKGDEDTPISFHGVAYINMVPLLYPGVKRLRGAYRVLAYQDAEVLEKTKCHHSVLRDVALQNSLMNKPTAAPPGLNSAYVKPTASRLAKDEKGAKDKEGGRR